MYLWHSSVHRATILRLFDTQAHTARSFWPYLTLKRTPCDDLISILFDAQAYTVRPFWLSLTLKRAPCDHFDILWHSSGEICSGPLGKTSPPTIHKEYPNDYFCDMVSISFRARLPDTIPGPGPGPQTRTGTCKQELANRNFQTGTFRQELSDRNFQTEISRQEFSDTNKAIPKDFFKTNKCR